MAKTKKQPQQVRILHTMVGPFPQGRIVTREQLTDVGADLNRLLNLKAIEFVDEDPDESPLPEMMEATELKKQGKLHLPIANEDGGTPLGDLNSELKEDQEDEEEEHEDEGAVALKDMTLKELREKATDLGIDKANSMAKGELISAIEEKQK
jgi:hypothetical protein